MTAASSTPPASGRGDDAAAQGHPCPKGDDCALNKGAIHCFHCRRNWPRDWTWDVPFEQRENKRRGMAAAESAASESAAHTPPRRPG
jgi:hypothetical protein